MEPNKDGVIVPPVPTPGTDKKDEKPGQDIDFDQELANLEADGSPEAVPPANPPRKSKEDELKQAIHTGKHITRRIKELGGDPNAVIDETVPPVEPPPAPPIDTSRFVTKEDLASIDARKLAKSEGEYKVIMWYVTKKGLSVNQAHLLANEKRIRTVMSETKRATDTVPTPGTGGAGADRPIDTQVPELPLEDRQRLAASGMVYDATKKAYVGKKVQYRFDGKNWITEKNSKS